jgi:hypothetical protein
MADHPSRIAHISREPGRVYRSPAPTQARRLIGHTDRSGMSERPVAGSTVVDPPRSPANFAPICRELIDHRAWQATLGISAHIIAKPGNHPPPKTLVPNQARQLTNRADQSGTRERPDGRATTSTVVDPPHTKANFTPICRDPIDQRLWQLRMHPGIHDGRVPHPAKLALPGLLCHVRRVPQPHHGKLPAVTTPTVVDQPRPTRTYPPIPPRSRRPGIHGQRTTHPA